MKSQTRRSDGLENSSLPPFIFTNDDLLTEILIRLPIHCIHLFTTVSKQWLPILTSTDFTERRRKIPNLDPPAGIFANRFRSVYECDFVSLDSRLNSKKSTMDQSFGSSEKVGPVKILHSYNGLLLGCGSTKPYIIYVCNPSTNLFKMLPQPNQYYPDDESSNLGSCVFRLAFDPRKSLNYKVVQLGGAYDDSWIQIYSSETGNWSLCRHQFSYATLYYFKGAMYWNDAFHWQVGFNHWKLNIEDNENPILTRLVIPHALYRGRKFVESLDVTSDGARSIIGKLSILFRLEWKFVESCGCLLHVCRDDIGSTQFFIYEMKNGASAWSVKYHVMFDQLMNTTPDNWSIRTSVLSGCLGDGEHDAFVVINLSGSIVKYNLISKTYTAICNIGSNQMEDAVAADDDNDIYPYLGDMNLYEFIPSLASV